MPISTSKPLDIFDKSTSNYPEGTIRGYQIKFEEVFKKILASDIQRAHNKRVFGHPNDTLYNFFDVTKDIQDRIESMGYTFLLSVKDGAEFDILIIE